MIIADINDDYIEVIALDKTRGKLHQLFHYYNFYISYDNPIESVISEDSYGQLNTKLTIDKILELKNARKTLKKLSTKKLNALLKEYKDYQNPLQLLYLMAKFLLVHYVLYWHYIVLATFLY